MSADLHLHTVYSDSTYTPNELIEGAKKVGLTCISVVDHDTVAGIESTILASQGVNVEVLPGIELTAEYEGAEVHILGYLIDYKSRKLIGQLELLKKIRIERIYKIVEKLSNMGMKLDPDRVFELAQYGTVGRLHVARAMVGEGLVDSTWEAFEKYIGDKSPAYVCGFRFSPKEAIELIKNIGGIPVLAHPYSLRNDDLIADFAKDGMMGLEVYYPEHSQGMINLYLRLAEQYNLLVTGGSDCHGSAKPKIKLGMIKIPDELVDKLKEAKNRL